MLNIRALAIAAAIGTILQVAMVGSGHTNKTKAGLFAVGGMSISLVGGRIDGASVSAGRLTGLSRGSVVADASATTADFAWLVGSWEGTLDSGAGTAYVTYSEPHAGLMTGVMHLVSPEKKVLVVELITLVDTPRGVEMRFRHFSSDLQAYEADFQQAMLLTSHDASRDVFQNQVAYSKALMSTQPRTTTIARQPDGSFVARSDIIGEDGKPSVISGTYRRMAKRD